MEGTCTCGCANATAVTDGEPCGCGCSTPAPQSREEQVAELRQLRDRIDQRLEQMQEA